MDGAPKLSKDGSLLQRKRPDSITPAFRERNDDLERQFFSTFVLGPKAVLRVL